ncbi:protein FAR1-related sequence 11 [Tanacetum coccineum]
MSDSLVLYDELWCPSKKQSHCQLEKDSQDLRACFEEEAFVFFRIYARNNGFSIRKGRFNNNKNGEKGRQDFFCHRQGKSDDKEIDLAIEDIGQTQVRDTMLEKYRGSNLRSQSSLEEQGYAFYTPFAFKKFQEEFGRAILYIVEEKTSSIGNTESMNNFEVDTDTIDLVGCPPHSKTKGCPKKRMKGGVELAKKANSQRAKKKKKIMSENKDINPVLSFKY